MGLQVYVDTILQFPGVNVAVGGEYVQFMPYHGTTVTEAHQKITIGRRGRAGNPAPLLNLPPAANARRLCEKGADGKEGNDGDGGKPGGDFCVSATKMLVGDDDQIIEKIYLSGGDAGEG